ncbi:MULTISPECIES: RIP metalloprotease RseP [Campylobacter]|uniref:Zinc metalloprotease n=1 Tax=Campylobacter porcelli TaxID=1660073 RepID=A0A1X9SWT4_9BACT|nr:MULTISPECIES: RIP metalloprotease RseP [unclassified Campylobacter]ARR00722.1 RseP-like zinc metalloprotease [Campylobacter sp. RM6137]MCR8678388.1 RIP metalloprotease RseP [Campylobacter sp. RM19072]
MRSLIFVSMLLIASFWYWGLHFGVTILALSFLIFFHELGHFLAAKYFGVFVKTFSIGFGEKIYSKKFGDTTYCLSAIPLGGYVQLKGQDDINPKDKNYDSDSYNTLSPLKRIIILFAGPFFNILLAFILYIALGFIGVERLAPVVGTILPNSAALSANIETNDRILAINGVKIEEWDEIKKHISTEPTNILIKRGDNNINITLTPQIGQSKNIFGETINTPLIGITPSGETTTIYNSGFNSIKFAYDETIKASTLIYKGLEKLITGVVPVNQMGGIVAMADITTKASQISISVLLIIVALISVNLGILNLLPLPVLDGGHIVFNLYEMIFKKAVNERVFVTLSYASMALLFTLMAFTIINDIVRLAGE